MSKLKELLRPKKEKLIDFPEFDENGKAVGQVLLKLLNEADHEEITIKANEETYRKLNAEASVVDQKSNTWAQLFELTFNLIASRHSLFKMCFDPDNKNLPFFENADEVKKLQPAQIEYINIEYTKLKKGNPHFTSMSSEEMENVIKNIKEDMESGANFLEHRLLPNLQLNFILYLVEELCKSRQMMSGLQLMQTSLLSVPLTESKPPELKNEPNLNNNK